MRRYPTGVADTPARSPAPMVRGVVMAVYFADGQEDRAVAMRQRDPKFYGVKTVAADVLTYGGRFRAYLSKVPVLPRRHALNDYEGLWIPRASTKDLSTGAAIVYPRAGAASTSAPTGDPRDFDGDHVLVEFLENDPTQPFIRDSLPHPRTTYTQLQSAGDAVESRFRGVVTRIDNSGNVLVDTTQANSGDTNAQGAETPANDSAHGNVTIKISSGAKLTVLDASNQNLLELDPDGATAVAKIGPGTSEGVKYAELMALYNNLVIWIAAHTHPDGWGSTAPPLPAPAVPAWDATIKAANLKIPSDS